MNILTIRNKCGILNYRYFCEAKNFANDPVSVKIKSIGVLLVKTAWDVIDGVGIGCGIISVNFKKPSNEILTEWSRK